MSIKLETHRHSGLESLNLQPAQPIKSVHSGDNKGFLASIKKAVNSCKNFFGLTANHKFDSVITTNHSAENMSIKPLEDNSIPSKHLNTEQLNAMAERIKQQKNASNIEKQNIQAINNYPGMAYQEKLAYQQVNEIGTAILSHPEFNNEIGHFRTVGAASQVQRILDHLGQGKSIDNVFIKENNINIRDLTTVYKKLMSNLLPITSSELKTLSTRFAQLNTEIPPMKNQPLSLQIAAPLLVEIAKHADKNRMDAKNLAIAFAPTFDKTDFTQIKVKNADEIRDLAQAPINYVTALIERELKNS